LGFVFFTLTLASLISACVGQLPPVIPGETPIPQATLNPPVTPMPPSPDAELLALPAAFRYQMVLHPAGQPNAASTLISGQYREGAWQQARRTSGGPDQFDEELIVARDPGDNALRSYTRAMTDTVWTRWPGVTFDAAYGLASPFTILRLRPLATQTAIVEERTTGPVGTTRTQALLPAPMVRRLLTAGIAAVAADSDSRTALENQVAAQFAPQTFTYWSDAQGRLVQAAGTLLILGPDNLPAPWLEMTVTYSGYDDPAVTVGAPAEAADIGAVAAVAAPSDVAVSPLESDPEAGVTLRVRVFATAGQPADDAIVTVYFKGKKTVVDERLGADAQFALKPGLYDVLVRAGGAEQWLKDVAVPAVGVASNDVLFDFAQLTVAVTLEGASPPVDVVVYPAGERVRFAGFATGNPVRFQLPAGLYDLEVATIDGNDRRRVDGVHVRGGLEATQSIDLAQP
jgi:hypothetical protein